MLELGCRLRSDAHERVGGCPVMSGIIDCIDLLEKLGGNAALWAAPSDLERLLAETGLDPELRAAIAAGDEGSLGRLLNARDNVCCLIEPHREDEEEDDDEEEEEEEEEESGDEDADEDSDDEDKRSRNRALDPIADLA